MNKNDILKAMTKLDKDSVMINRLKEFGLEQDCWKCLDLIHKHDKALDISKTTVNLSKVVHDITTSYKYKLEAWQKGLGL